MRHVTNNSNMWFLQNDCVRSKKWVMKNYSTMYESFPANHELADKLLLAAHDQIQVAFTVEKRLKVWWKHWLPAETYVLTVHDLRPTPFPTS